MAWPTWEIDEEALKGAFTARTSAIVLNTPNNPTAKVFSRQELKPAAGLQRNRYLLCGALSEVGFKSVRPDGAYYIMADHTPFGLEDDRSFTKHLVEDIGVAVVPGSSFFSDPEDGRAYVRFMFSKRDETLQEAATRLRKLEPT